MCRWNRSHESQKRFFSFYPLDEGRLLLAELVWIEILTPFSETRDHQMKDCVVQPVLSSNQTPGDRQELFPAHGKPCVLRDEQKAASREASVVQILIEAGLKTDLTASWDLC